MSRRTLKEDLSGIAKAVDPRKPSSEVEEGLRETGAIPSADAPRVPQANREFVSNFSHALSQPLTALRGSLELTLLKPRTGTEYRKCLEEALEQADRLVGVLRAVRHLVNMEGPGGVKERVSLGAIVEEITEDLRPVAESRSVKLSLQKEIDSTVLGDAQRLRQAIFNLVGNAIQACREGKTVQVSLSCRGEEACLAVSDEGPGIPSHELPYVFEPFCRIPPGGEPSEVGDEATLNLAVANRIVQAVGGRIHVESQPGRGSCFRIFLPKAPA